jgi:PAS domain S-box-containing protein
MTRIKTNQLATLKECGDLIPHSVCVFGKNGKLLFANKHLLDELDSSLEDLEKSLAAPNSAPLRTLVEACLADNSEKQWQIELELKPGHPSSYLVKGQPLSSHSEPYCIVSLTQMQLRLVDRQKYQTGSTSESPVTNRSDPWELMEALPHLIWCCDDDNYCVYANKRLLDYSGWTLVELKYDWYDLLHPDDREPTRHAWAEAFRGPGQYSTNHRLKGADGEYRWFHSRATPLCDRDGAVKNWFGTSTDIHDQVLAKAELERTVQALDRESAKRLRADQELHTQYSVTAALAVANSMQEASPQILEAICNNLGWDWGSIWTRSDLEERARRDCQFLTRSEGDEDRKLPPQLQQTVQDFVESTIDKRRPLWISRSSDKNSGEISNRSPYYFPSGTALALPIITELGCSTCMVFFTSKSQEPDKEVLQTLTSIAANIGQQIDYWRTEELTRSQGLQAMRTETRLRAILSSMREGIFQIDSEGRCIYLNPAAEKILGYELEEVQTKNMHDLVYARHLHGQDCNKNECPIVSVIDTGQPCHIEEDAFLSKDQTLLTVQFSSAPLIVDDTLAGAVVVFRDIGELVKLRQQRDSFFAILTHDLKTPLLAADRVLGPLLQGASGPFNEEQSHVLELLRKSNSELLQMVQIVLALYRYSDSKTLHSEPVDIKSAARFAVVQTSGLAQSRNVKVIETSSLTDSSAVYADSTAVQHLIANLLENAIKFTPSGGHVDLSLSQENGSIKIEVRDSGLGLSNQELKSLFHPVPQQRLGKRNMLSNSGLGLYLCKQIVDSYRGQIACQSMPGEGAVFTVTLPTMRTQPGHPPKNRSEN